MARYRFVDPDSTRLDLTDGDWIEVKVELTAGETRDLYGRMRPYVVPGEPNQLIAKEVGIARLIAYVIDWSLRDRAGKPVPVNEKTIDGVDMDTFQEMLAAVDAHITRHDEHRLAEKNGRAGSLNSVAT
jgi:hypothetical protein